MLMTTCNVGCASGAILEEDVLNNTGAHQNFYWGNRGDLTLRQYIISVWLKELCYNKTGSVIITQDWDAFLRPLMQWKSCSYNVCRVWVCNLSYAACNAPCCHLWPVRLHHIFPRYLINGTIFEKKKNVIKYKMCVSIFFTTYVWNISYSKNREHST